MESARTLSDSSTDTEGKNIDEIHSFGNRLLQQILGNPQKEGKRHRNSNNSRSTIEQCEREINRLQSSVDLLRQKLEESELKDSDSLDAIAVQSDNKIRSIISRLVLVLVHPY